MDWEIDLLRDRLADLEDLANSIDPRGSSGSVSVVVITLSLGAYPTTAAPLVYAGKVVTVTGSRTENVAPTLTTETAVIMFAQLASVLIPLGTKVVVHSVADSRWATRYDGT